MDRVRLKDRILDNISKAIKTIQDGCRVSRDIVLTIEDRECQRLCENIDHALLHGLRHITNGYWRVVKEFTHKSLVKEIGQYTQVTTNLGKGRAWLYMSLNESLLESYMKCFLESPQHLKKYYAKDAFILDVQRLSVLVSLTADLETATFNLDCDVPYLDLSTSPPRPRTESRSSGTNDEDRISLRSADSSSSLLSPLPKKLSIPESLRTMTDSDYFSCGELTGNHGNDPVSDAGTTSGDSTNHSADLNRSADNESVSSLRIAGQFGEGGNRMTRLGQVRDVGDDDDVDVVYRKPKVRRKKKNHAASKSDDIKTDGVSQSMTSDASCDLDQVDICMNALDRIEIVANIDQSQGDLSDDVQSGSGLVVGDTTTDVDTRKISPDVSERETASDTKVTKDEINTSNTPGENGIVDDTRSHDAFGWNDRVSVSVSSNDHFDASCDDYCNGVLAAALSNKFSRNLPMVYVDESDVHINEHDISNAEDLDEIRDFVNDTRGSHREDDGTAGVGAENRAVISHKEIIDGFETTRSACGSEDDTPIHRPFQDGAVLDCDQFADIYNTFSNDTEVSEQSQSEHSSIDVVGNSESSTSGKFPICVPSSHANLNGNSPDVISDGDKFPDSSSAIHDTQIESLEVSDVRYDYQITIDNNNLLHIMLDVLTHDMEQCIRMFATRVNHTEGEATPVFVLITDHCLYMIRQNHKKSQKKFTKMFTVPLNDIDYVSVGVDGQILHIVCTNRRKQYWLTTGDQHLTQEITQCLTRAVDECEHQVVTPLSVLTDATVQKIALKKFVAAESRLDNIQQADIGVYVLVHWEDGTSLTSHVGVHKEGRLLYKTEYNLFVNMWKLGYVVLRGGTLSVYQARHSDTKPVVFLDLAPSQCIGCRRVINSDKRFCVEIRMYDGTWIELSAPTAREANDWNQLICQAVTESALRGKMERKCVPCSMILSSRLILMCHEELDTSFVRTLGSAKVTDVTAARVPRDEPLYCILEFDSQDDRISSGQWVIYFNSSHETRRFMASLSEFWMSHFQVDLQVSELQDAYLLAKIDEMSRSLRKQLVLRETK